jgi:RNA polymerase sigma factor for flagellar operon FliA
LPVDVDLAELERRRHAALKIARAFIRKLPASVRREDIEQAALIGLWDALRKNPDVSGPGFEWFVRCRIRGAIIDELRAQDWLPRRTRTTMGKHIGVSYLEDEHDIMHWTERLSSFGASPEDVLVLQSEADEALRAPMQPKDRRTVELLLFRGLRMIDVAAELGCSEPRVSQRFARALETMRAHLTGRFDPPSRKLSSLSARDRERIVRAKEGKAK